jgi:predicted RNA-binding protein YlqC (UPF0109 family)
MSVSKLSQTLQQKIMQNLLDNVSRDIQAVQLTLPGKRFGSSFIKTEVTSANVTRLLTDPNQTGIFGREGLKELASGFKKIAENTVAVGTRVIGKDGNISKQAGYKILKTHLSNQVKQRNPSITELEALQLAVQELASKADSILSNKNLYSDFMSFVRDSKQRAITELDENTFAIPNTQHATINKLFSEYLINKTVAPELVEFIAANTDAGHLLGIFNQKLFRGFGATISDTEYGLGEISVDVFSNIKQLEAEDTERINKLNSTFSAAFNLLEYIDFLSSSIKTSPDVFVKLSKEVYLDPDNPNAAAEIQLSFDNSESGRLLTKAGKQLETLISSASAAKFITLPGGSSQVRDPKSAEFAKQLENIFKELGAIASVTKEMARAIQVSENKILNSYVKNIILKADSLGDTLLNAEGSDSVKTALAKRLASILSKKPLPSPSKTQVSKLDKVKPAKATTTKVKGKLPVEKTTTATITAPKRAKRQTVTVSAANLTSLQNLINRQLQDVVSANMGDGDSRNVLNYRTGRLASSAKVEYMSESRAGMITAFYSYMKNPYATFSDGGKQSSPRSRDPKLLIAKSIREIAQQQVGNRLRAVNI